MAFCKFCGRQLQEGEVCNCQAANAQPVNNAAPVQPNPAPGQPYPGQPNPGQPNPGQPAGGTPVQPSVTITLPNKAEVSNVVNKIISTIMGVLKHPSTESKAFVAGGDRNTALGIIILQALISSIFSLCVIGKINSLLGFGGSLTSSYKFSGLTAFFVTLLFSLVFSVIMVALFYLAAIILKLATNLNQVLCVVAVRSVALLPIIVLACIFFLINVGVGLGLFYGSILLAMIFLLEAVKGIPNMQDNKAAYVVFIVTIVFAVLFMLIGTKMALNMYLPKAIRDMMSGDSILETLIEEMM